MKPQNIKDDLLKHAQALATSHNLIKPIDGLNYFETYNFIVNESNVDFICSNIRIEYNDQESIRKLIELDAKFIFSIQLHAISTLLSLIDNDDIAIVRNAATADIWYDAEMVQDDDSQQIINKSQSSILKVTGIIENIKQTFNDPIHIISVNN
ncbi:hypothetical protein UA38_11915 [Photobacterium kishitanii]|uniref:Uncharacterized protein n=1 Tax=Photobacterium kishitanii TaxID=318456 RepID=A0AAX0YWQ9_9GAMM|nr:hypothetical protein [Photobacterium kishitanii]KJG57074.1 hypothetical protein UA38_11915 [Photobacterium kishitanii]KJG60601.1 hypothetical protein UA42_14715 [Photobacterium kishitanii]KJG64903.1 hypothetical protein UA40_14410 [Photobacterium kishitanii]KJG68539.1 hypothetical protein UA41_16820 [Photobacterium kishitanii]OBU31432.1 hypothetical protein AYY23_19410 [Photobacterium kishitanii]